MFHPESVSSKRRRRRSTNSSDGGSSAGSSAGGRSLTVFGTNSVEDIMAENEDSPMPGVRVEENPEHGMKVLRSLCFLKKEKVLCDITLIAEGDPYSKLYL